MTTAQLSQGVAELAGRANDRHLVLQFDSPLTPAIRGQLERSGIKVLAYVGDNAFFASLTGGAIDVATISATPTLWRVSAIDRAWKLHPNLLTGNPPDWAIVEPAEAEKGRDSAMVGAYILFHSDVALAPDGVNLAVRHGALVRSHLETVNGLVIELPYSNIAALADEDGVQWIEPPLPRMEELNNSNRVITQADIVQAPPYGLNGSGVTVMVYDGGFGLSTHQDFGGRLFVRDSSGLSNHSTHVAGTIGGSGVASGGLRKGMAPAVTIQSYGFQYDGSGIFLYSNPGDMQADYNQAINVHGSDIANNSIGTNTCANGFPCNITGDYGVTSAVIDNIVAGTLGAPMRIVWANGNERGCSGCSSESPGGYHSTAPPACAKNHLTVGALNSNDDSMTSFSSWGPCDDGRLKPDVSAPGCQSNDDGGVTSCGSSGNTSYSTLCGTSMASPTVCGLGALLLQDYRVQFPGNPDFRNSTLRTLLAHTAIDRGTTGPDYKFGYGSVRIQGAIDFMRTGNFLEESVGQGEVYSLLVIVNPGDPVMKVTLAWDDPAAAPNANPSLVNDLDLVVFDPSSVQRFPWTLNPAVPSAAAVQTQKDNRNNIEQVFVSAPAAGAWRVEVRGFNVPSGPQAFSLAASPLLVNCSEQGVITLDRVEYACESTAGIQVVDCDLNTDDLTIETVSVTIESSTETGGETVVLTETAPESAAFLGTITLSATDAPGVLQVTDGDTITARYIDADDGQGGINVVVEAGAAADCAPPIITNVQAINVGPASATITFNTNEPAAGHVRYGLSCGALSGSADGSGFNTAHSVALTGLSDNTNYFYAVDADDQAGNSATNDNTGLCYTFSTPDIPNYFTEEFGGDADLDNVTLFFRPDGSFDFYDECAESATSLPTDPAGGTALVFAPTTDDGFALVSLAGGATVKLYGNSYSSFNVGSNGYVTFLSGDDDYDETLAEHFSFRRVAGHYDDLHPGQGGSVSWRQLADRAAVTWQDVPEYNAGNQNTFQIELFFDGEIDVTYLNMDATDAISGLSAGNGLPSPFFETDLSAAGICLVDCNNNGISDPVDISGGFSEDCNGNIIPDECETGLATVIERQPVSIEKCENGSVSFTVLGSGYGTIQYQWYKGTNPIGGATGPIYTIGSVQVSDAGVYSAEVSGPCGTLTSDSATLTVLTPASCDDGNDCTTDSCNPFFGCTHPFNANACDDGNTCTVDDACALGSCTGTPVVRLFADIMPSGGDGVSDLDDLLCLLAGIASFASCPDADLMPCGAGDGVVDLDDLVVVLDAFAGNYACPHPCPP